MFVCFELWMRWCTCVRVFRVVDAVVRVRCLFVFWCMRGGGGRGREEGRQRERVSEGRKRGRAERRQRDRGRGEETERQRERRGDRERQRAERDKGREERERIRVCACFQPLACVLGSGEQARVSAAGEAVRGGGRGGRGLREGAQVPAGRGNERNVPTRCTVARNDRNVPTRCTVAHMSCTALLWLIAICALTSLVCCGFE